MFFLTMPKRRVLGIDPGLGRCGWAVVTVDGQNEIVEGSGCITTPAGLPLAQRLLRLEQEIEKILTTYHPMVVATEQLIFSKNVTTAMMVSQARGVILASAARRHLSVVELSPTSVKQSVTGSGRADKRQMSAMLHMLLKLKKVRRTDDEIDAIGIALTSAHQSPR